MTDSGRIHAEDVADQNLKDAINLIESKGFYVVRFPDRELRQKILNFLTKEPQDLHVITEGIYGEGYSAKDQYRVRSCLRRLRDAGIIVMDGTVQIGRVYVGKWRLA